ncbi:MAG: hypothetical protein HYV27_14850 [Candidatus Hydrogenedentes bacterium]|nr:hypothetical protein [Candidatus Hydrogenedentota bacterium]
MQWKTEIRLMLLCVLALILGTSRASADAATEGQETRAYVVGQEESLLARYAPVFVVDANDLSYNAIGTPKANKNKRGKETVYIDPAEPAVYGGVHTFETSKGTYTNLFYRVHFERSPFTWAPFNASAGHNVGFFTVITLGPGEKPYYVNTVQSCGCYHAVTPTNLLPADQFPAGWDQSGFENYGEHVPGILNYPEDGNGGVRLAVFLRSGVHRARDLQMLPMANIERDYDPIVAPLRPLEDLKHLPVAGGGETSLYYTKGYKRGLVKGAYKPWETVLFGLWTGDAHVGQDREYGTKDETGRLFYTTLSRSKKKASDMSDYAGFLELNGWKP